MANKPKEAQPINRNGYWYLVRRVPEALVPLDGRRTVIWSTGVAVHQDPRAVWARVLVRQPLQATGGLVNGTLIGHSSLKLWE